MHDRSLPPSFIFDMGGVVIRWNGNDIIYKMVAKRYGVPFSRLEKAMEDRIPILEGGREDSFTYLEKSLDSVGKKIRENEDAESLLAKPFEKLVKLRLGTVQVIKTLRRRGHGLYGFSNTSPPHLKVMRKLGYVSLFDSFFASCEIKLLKPEPAAYTCVMKEIDVKPDSVVFIDNSQANIEGAKKAGIRHGILFRTIPQLRKEIGKALREFE